MSQDAAASKSKAIASNIGHISAAAIRATSTGPIAKTDAADDSIAGCSLLHQWSLGGLIVVTTPARAGTSCSGSYSGGCIVKVTIAVTHGQTLVVAVIIAS